MQDATPTRHACGSTSVVIGPAENISPTRYSTSVTIDATYKGPKLTQAENNQLISDLLQSFDLKKNIHITVSHSRDLLPVQRASFHDIRFATKREEHMQRKCWPALDVCRGPI